MQQRTIDIKSLAKGMQVYFKYDRTSMSGPFIVTSLYRDHEGPQVVLRGTGHNHGNNRTILLADDEDYGALSFYVNP